MRIKFKLAQIDLMVGDFKGNLGRISRVIGRARKDGTDVLVFPELAVTGYPPEDLVFRKRFVRENREALRAVARLCRGLLCIVGFVDKKGTDLFNAAAVIYDGKVRYIYRKIHLPNYSVFDEKRYFRPGTEVPVVQIGKIRFGLGICEDLWVGRPPADLQTRFGRTSFIVNINASPYYLDKNKKRLDLLKRLARASGNMFLYLNLVGGQDEMVFDGNSLAVDGRGRLLASGKAFEEDILDLVCDVEEKKGKTDFRKIRLVRIKGFKPHDHGEGKTGRSIRPVPPLSREGEVYKALVTGTRDYIMKNGFKKAVIGISGGIDSALTAVIAADAIGRENVLGVFMPSPFSSEESRRDAARLAENLGIELAELPVTGIYERYMEGLKGLFGPRPADTAEENIQARIRGNLLMALSNKFGHLVLATGNKSEMSTGYSTLYGDLAGGFAVIKDVYKSMVYRLAEHRNGLPTGAVIPENIMRKAPTAELKENQKDSDTLPEYGVLDSILYYYIEKNRTYTEILNLKRFDPRTVSRVITLVDKSEYKRRQAPPGIKISEVSFGKDRRMPITNGYLLGK